MIGVSCEHRTEPVCCEAVTAKVCRVRQYGGDAHRCLGLATKLVPFVLKRSRLKLRPFFLYLLDKQRYCCLSKFEAIVKAVKVGAANEAKRNSTNLWVVVTIYIVPQYSKAVVAVYSTTAVSVSYPRYLYLGLVAGIN